MSFYTSLYSADAQYTALQTALTSNTTDEGTITSLIANYNALQTAVTTATATMTATPTTGNATALATAISNYQTQNEGLRQAVAIGIAVLRPGEFNRTLAPLQALLIDAIAKVDAQAQSYGTNPTLSNAALQAQYNAVSKQMRDYYNQSLAGQFHTIADLQPVITFLTV